MASFSVLEKSSLEFAVWEPILVGKKRPHPVMSSSDSATCGAAVARLRDSQVELHRTIRLGRSDSVEKHDVQTTKARPRIATDSNKVVSVLLSSSSSSESVLDLKLIQKLGWVDRRPTGYVLALRQTLKLNKHGPTQSQISN